MAQKKKKVTTKTGAAKASNAHRVPTNFATRKPTSSKPGIAKTPARKSPVKAPAAQPMRHRKVATKPAISENDGTASAGKITGARASAAPVKSGQPAKPASGAAAPRTMPAAVARPAQQKVSAPMTPKDIAVKTAEARQTLQPAKKPVHQRHGFKVNEYVVYPAHGVGRIVGIEEQEIAGMSLELFVITFDKDKMTLRVPTGKLQSVGMRKLADEATVKKAMETLKGRARIKRTMWSRRAQEYEAKINSGDLIAIAEVVRDLYRSETQPEQSYSERQLYEAALDRMAREVASVEKLDERGAVQRITEVLAKSARGRRLAAEGAAETREADAKAA
jgi:CarD family transcriptional regulator